MQSDQDAVSRARTLFLEALDLQERGELGAAEANLREALSLVPGRESILVNLSGLLLSQQRYDEARPYCDALMHANTANPEAWLNAAICDLHELRLDDARAKLERAAALDPTHAMVLLELGRLHQMEGRFDAAIEVLRSAASRMPENAESWRLQALALQGAGQHDAALEAARTAAALAPEHAPVWLALGNALCDTGRPADAIEPYEKGLVQAPDSAEMHHNLGNAHACCGHFEEAIRHYDNALMLNPASHLSVWNRGLAHLALGDFKRGFADYEARWLTGRQPAHNMAGKLWSGEDLSGKRLLIHAEQGFGDMIMFGRFAIDAARQGARVQLAVPPQLRVLFSGLTGGASVVSTREEVMLHDFQCPVMSLPRALGLCRDDLPGSTAYVQVPHERRVRWSGDVSGWKQPRIGLMWSSSEKGPYRIRSMPFRSLLPLAEIEASFWSLQQDSTPDDEEFIQKSAWLKLPGARFEDFADTAAFMEQLDLVISVDTASAHLAGALGKPVWVLLPHVADWRWQSGNDRSPWYPSARLFRQPAPGDWDGLVADALLPALRQFSAR